MILCDLKAADFPLPRHFCSLHSLLQTNASGNRKVANIQELCIERIDECHVHVTLCTKIHLWVYSSSAQTRRREEDIWEMEETWVVLASTSSRKTKQSIVSSIGPKKTTETRALTLYSALVSSFLLILTLFIYYVWNVSVKRLLDCICGFKATLRKFDPNLSWPSGFFCSLG